jgi:hypothetical protein
VGHGVSGAGGGNTRAALLFSSILRRQEDRSGTAIRFGDDPEFLAFTRSIRAQESKALIESEFVFADIFFGEFTPLARHVQAQELKLGLSGDLECFFGSGRDEGLT